MHERYPHLFSPLKLGPYTLKNRIVATAMSAGNLDAEYKMTDMTYAMFENFAKGGAAVVTVGNTLVHTPTGNNHGRCIKLDDPVSMSSLIRLSDRIKRHGVLASIQLLHGGRRADPQYTEGGKIYGPSAGTCQYGPTRHEVIEMDEEMIDTIVNAFGDAAEMAMLGGFNMCQVHGGHGWLINQFLSPANNQRTDRFGGSIENRARFAIMVVDNVRKKCGPNFPIEFRLSGEDFMEDGATLEDTVALAKMLDDKVDIFQVSATSFHNYKAALRMFPNMYLERGCNAYLAEAIKKHVKSPVITVGAFNDPVHMENTIANGVADVIALGRALTIEPDLPEKIRTGREDDIIYCLRCGLCNSGGFVPYVKYALGVGRCVVNPWKDDPIGRQTVGQYHGDETVLVVGGGPGGMEAALGAAENGNKVILLEKSSCLGGMLRTAWHPAAKQDLKRFIDVLGRRIARNPNIEVRLNTEATPELIRQIEPDTLILALGSRTVELDIPGRDDPRVVNVTRMHEDGVTLGDKIVIVGAGLAGVEEGIALAQQGKDVTVIEMGDKPIPGAHYFAWLISNDQFEKLPNLKFELRQKVTSVDEKGVHALDDGGKEHVYAADNIIIAIGVKPLREEADKLRDVIDTKVKVVGDLYMPATAYEAVRDGYFAGYSIHK